MTPFEKRVIRKLWSEFGPHETQSFEDWLKATFCYSKINETEQLLDAVYDGKGFLWPKRRNDVQSDRDSGRIDIPS